MRRRASCRRSLLPAAVLVLGLVAGAAHGEEPSVTQATARITYLTGSSAYIDAGAEEGIEEGDELEVVREGQRVATIEILYVSSHRASGSIAEASVALVVGDTVRYTPKNAPAEPAPGGAAPPLTDLPSPRRVGAVHGRIGLRYLAVSDRSDNESDYSQPAGDLRLDGYALAGSPVDLNIDLRSRRTRRTMSDGSTEEEDETRLYRGALTCNLPRGQHLVAGRQFAPALAGLSIFDGLLYGADGLRFGGGLFGGVQPDPADYGQSSEVHEYGGYLLVHSKPDAPKRWSVTTGLVGSYTHGTVDREFVYLQGQYHGRRLSAYTTQEVDYNRDWKVDEAGEHRVSATGGFASLHYRAGERVTLYGGYDNRRNVRLYRDRVTPATKFDDSYRQGAWAGTSVRLARHLEVSADARGSHEGPAGSSDAYSLSVAADGLGQVGLGVRTRATRYTNDRSEGWLHTLSTGLNLGQRCHLELSGGTLDETDLTDSELDRNQHWFALDLDVGLGRRWYVLLSAESTRGDSEEYDQGYASITYRF